MESQEFFCLKSIDEIPKLTILNLFPYPFGPFYSSSIHSLFLIIPRCGNQERNNKLRETIQSWSFWAGNGFGQEVIDCLGNANRFFLDLLSCHHHHHHHFACLVYWIELISAELVHKSDHWSSGFKKRQINGREGSFIIGPIHFPEVRRAP